MNWGKRYAIDPPPDVQVEHRKDGCGICGSRDKHTHRQDEWRAAVDKAGETLTRKRGQS
ncbi:MAG: hypothetical protein ACRCZP_09335 [Phycicoccus sp.]